MQLAIGRPVSGWLPVSISIGGHSSSFLASGFVNDPLTEFIAPALWCLDTGYPMPVIEPWMNPPHSEFDARGIHFWLEPAWHSLLLLKVKGSDDIRLRFYVNHTGGLFVDEDDFRTSIKTDSGPRRRCRLRKQYTWRFPSHYYLKCMSMRRNGISLFPFGCFKTSR